LNCDELGKTYVSFLGDLERRTGAMLDLSSDYMNGLHEVANVTKTSANKLVRMALQFHQATADIEKKCKKLDDFEIFLDQVSHELKRLEVAVDQAVLTDATRRSRLADKRAKVRRAKSPYD